jgi:hypothetical protein
MVTMITMHMLSKDNREKAKWVLTTNTELARKANGFINDRVLTGDMVYTLLRGHS